MAQITLTLDLTLETVNALRVLVETLNTKTDNITVALDQTSPETATVKPEKPAAKSKTPKTEKAIPEKPSEPKIEEPSPEIPSEEIPEITLTDARAQALLLSKKDNAALREILKKYGGPPISKIAKEDLPAVLADIQEALNG